MCPYILTCCESVRDVFGLRGFSSFSLAELYHFVIVFFLECDSAYTSAYNSSYSAYLLGFLLLLSSSLWAFSMRKSAFFFYFALVRLLLLVLNFKTIYRSRLLMCLY